MLAAMRLSEGPILDFDAQKVSIADYLESWLKDCARSNAGPNCYDRYRTAVEMNIGPILGGVILGKLTAAHVRAMKQALLDQGLAPDTVAYVQGVLSTALNQAVADRILLENPSRLVKKAKDRKEKMRPLDEMGARALVDEVRGTRDEAFYLLACRIGPRRGELLGLRWEDLDAERRELTIRRSVVIRKGEERWSLPKDGEERTVKLGSKMTAALLAHRKLQAEERLQAPSWEKPDLIFPNRRGQVARPSTVHDRFKRHLKLAGLPEIRFHDLRHTAATLMLRNGVDIRTTADILGHKDPAMTLRRYAHVLSDMQQAAADRMDEVLS